MKASTISATPLVLLLAFAGLCLLPAADDPDAGIPGLKRQLEGWGAVEDPDGDCEFVSDGGKLVIKVPGENGPHDLAADVNVINAPRVVQVARGDFTCEVIVDGDFIPGGDSTLPGRTGYRGAGIIAMVDPQNVVTLARATLQRAEGDPVPYANFEMRDKGRIKRLGNAGDAPIPLQGPVHLRLSRKGNIISGAVSTDGKEWKKLEDKELPEDWPERLYVGLVGISTSKMLFSPEFSDLKFRP